MPDVQPAIMLDEFAECEAACKANPEWQAAMRKRGVTDFDLCMVDPWSAGNYGIEDETGPSAVAGADLGAHAARTTTATPARSRT